MKEAFVYAKDKWTLMNVKKILLMCFAVTTVLIVLIGFSVGVSAEDPAIAVDVWDGTADNTWYYEDQGRSEYTLKTAEQLAGLAELVNSKGVRFENVTIKLGADIILNEGTLTANDFGAPVHNGVAVDPHTTSLKSWPVIGERPASSNSIRPDAGRKYFCGNFDGKGHVISGLYVLDVSNTCYAGFMSIFAGEEFKNLTIINSYICCASRAGVFAAFVTNGDKYDFIAENLYTNAYVAVHSADKNARSGGIFGTIRYTLSTTLKNLWFDGVIDAKSQDVSKPTPHIAGIVSQICQEESGEKIIVDSCLVTGSIYAQVPFEGVDDTSSNTFGGLVANIYTRRTDVSVSVSNCFVAIRQTNINSENGFVKDGKSAFVGRFENAKVKYTIDNSYYIINGLFSTANSVLNQIGEEYFIEINGVRITQATLLPDDIVPTARLENFNQIDFLIPAFTLRGSGVALKGLRYAVGDGVFDYEEDITDEPVTGTYSGWIGSMIEQTELPLYQTEASDSRREKNSKNKEKSCSCFSAVAAIVALAVGSAVIVIKKKD